MLPENFLSVQRNHKHKNISLFYDIIDQLTYAKSKSIWLHGWLNPHKMRLTWNEHSHWVLWIKYFHSFMIFQIKVRIFRLNFFDCVQKFFSNFYEWGSHNASSSLNFKFWQNTQISMFSILMLTVCHKCLLILSIIIIF